MKILNVLSLTVVMSLRAFAQPEPEVRFGDGTEHKPKVRAKVIDMLRFILPTQSHNSERQFHLEGYMQCMRIPNSPWVKDGDPEYARGNFGKDILSDPDERGNVQFTSSKAATGLLGHPCEYFETRDTYDEDGNLVTILYIKREMMDWVYNRESRAYYDGMDEPLFEWGRSRAIEGQAYVQNPGFEVLENCNGSISVSPLQPAIYIAYTFSLEESIEEINLRLGLLGPIDPNWPQMARDAGQKEFMVLCSRWGMRGLYPSPEKSNWNHQELYFYIPGRGRVSWRPQEHIDQDPFKDFITHKIGNMDKVVWESQGKIIRNIEPCENPGAEQLSQSQRMMMIPPRFSIRTDNP